MNYHAYDLFSFDECRSILKVSKGTLLSLLHNKELDGFKLGNRWKIPGEAIIEFIENRL